MDAYYDFTINVQVKIENVDQKELDDAIDAACSAAQDAIKKIIVGSQVVDANIDYECYDAD